MTDTENTETVQCGVCLKDKNKTDMAHWYIGPVCLACAADFARYGCD